MAEEYLNQTLDSLNKLPEDNFYRYSILIDCYYIYFLNGDFVTYLEKMRTALDRIIEFEEKNKRQEYVPKIVLLKISIQYGFANLVTLEQITRVRFFSDLQPTPHFICPS